MSNSNSVCFHIALVSFIVKYIILVLSSPCPDIYIKGANGRRLQREMGILAHLTNRGFLRILHTGDSCASY